MDALLSLPWDRLALGLAISGVVGMAGAVSWLARSYQKAKDEISEVLKTTVSESTTTIEGLKPLIQGLSSEVPRLHDTVRHEHNITRDHVSNTSDNIKGRLPPH